MIHNVLGDPLKSTHQEILEEKQAREDHIVDVLPKCRRIMEIGHVDIDR